MRSSIPDVKMKKNSNQSQTNDILEHRFVMSEIHRLHGNQQDFDEGDLSNRIDKFGGFPRACASLKASQKNWYLRSSDSFRVSGTDK